MDSDEEYEQRRRSRDKFRRERNDYERREERGRRDQWDDGGGRRGGDSWGRRGIDHDRRDSYNREYDRRRGDRYNSPPPRSPPHKRMRSREWDEPGGYGHYDGPPFGGQGGGGWDHDIREPRDRHREREPIPSMPEKRPPNPDYPSQPLQMTFKQFLASQDDSISDEEAVKKFAEYKLEFHRDQINEFFLAHKDEEWFKAKYHPEECEKRHEDQRAVLKRRVEVFQHLVDKGFIDGHSLDHDCVDKIVRFLDAVVILLEGGDDYDLTVLDMTEEQLESQRHSAECAKDIKKYSGAFVQSEPKPEEETEESEQKEAADETGDSKPEDKAMSPVQEEIIKKAREFLQNKDPTTSEHGSPTTTTDIDETDGKKTGKKRKRDKSEYNYDTGSGSESGSESNSDPNEPAPPGVESQTNGADTPTENPPAVTTATTAIKESCDTEDGEVVAKKENEADSDEKDVDTEKQKFPKELHRTSSIFLRNLAPSITKSEVEAVCKRYPGFIRVALQDPQPERRFFRRGWVTFDRSVNIKDICWNLNNIRLRECELGAIVNRELKQRVRFVSGLAVHKHIVKQDVKNAAKIIQAFDNKWKLWEEEEKTDTGKQTFGLVSKNPVLKNITDYLVEEGSYEEEELLGQPVDDKPKEENPEIAIDHEPQLNQVLDRLILYLRVVYSLDYYSASEYPNEDEMPHRCGIIHARGPLPTSGNFTQTDVNEYLNTFSNKIDTFVNYKDKLDTAEALKLGLKDIEAEVEKFVTANTQEMAKDKWLCPLSGKKFKGPDFVRKHIFNKHGEKIEEVKQVVTFFNNYLFDPKRPLLPEHPGNTVKKEPREQPAQQSSPPSAGGGYNQRSMQGAGGGLRTFRKQATSRGGQSFGGGFDREPFGGRDKMHRRGQTYPHMRGSRRQQDPRQIIEYRDLDAPDDMDIF
ncbi:serrate RNA effector molecule homolog [Tubulanus polymorphus]|uniref:serrate RNA effector molecule homolog n=1 Tax=Tubulanus polymorphus TaxID=672921 RepID=UPI003DA69B01